MTILVFPDCTAMVLMVVVGAAEVVMEVLLVTDPPPPPPPPVPPSLSDTPGVPEPAPPVSDMVVVAAAVGKSTGCALPASTRRVLLSVLRQASPTHGCSGQHCVNTTT